MKVFDGISMDRAVKDINDLVEKSKRTLDTFFDSKKDNVEIQSG